MGLTTSGGHKKPDITGAATITHLGQWNWDEFTLQERIFRKNQCHALGKWLMVNPIKLDPQELHNRNSTTKTEHVSEHVFMLPKFHHFEAKSQVVITFGPKAVTKKKENSLGNFFVSHRPHGACQHFSGGFLLVAKSSPRSALGGGG